MKTINKRPVIRLKHPRLGLIDEKKVQKMTKDIIIQAWRWKYGKKFNECTVEEDKPNTAKIQNLATKKIYENIDVAEKETGLTRTTLYKHLNKKTENQKFKWLW